MQLDAGSVPETTLNGLVLMTDFFRSPAARELAGLMRARMGASPSAEPERQTDALDDIEYYTLRSCKQIELAERAPSELVRDTHLKLADLFGERARAAMGAAMRTNAPSNDVRAAAFLRLDEFRLDDLLGSEQADRFRSLRID